MVEQLRQNAIEGPWETSERLLVCVGPDPLSMDVVRAASRLATGLNASWVAASVEIAGRAAADADRRGRRRRGAQSRAQPRRRHRAADRPRPAGRDSRLRAAREHHANRRRPVARELVAQARRPLAVRRAGPARRARRRPCRHRRSEEAARRRSRRGAWRRFAHEVRSPARARARGGVAVGRGGGRARRSC